VVPLREREGERWCYDWILLEEREEGVSDFIRKKERGRGEIFRDFIVIKDEKNGRILIFFMLLT
jgi:hypothetical protein